tara:strand:- start:981 stop:1094 length:114 start_codon:yes stop_codon:yes gene_type:complete
MYFVLYAYTDKNTALQFEAVAGVTKNKKSGQNLNEKF